MKQAYNETTKKINKFGKISHHVLLLLLFGKIVEIQ